jgi:[ribosomal protein S18]-alanine N-acetyltransferase
MSAEGLRVRVAVVGDLAGVMALERSVAEAPHWVEGEYAVIIAGRDGLVRRCLLIAEAEGRLLGFAVGKVIGAGVARVAELESVVVVEAARRRGAGGALCRGVVAWCRGEGAATVELEVRAGSGGAIALYEGLGFVAVGRRKGYYGDPVEDAVMMRLGLGEAK